MADMLRFLAAKTEAVSATMPAENINKMWSTVVTGLVVVFIILILLVIVLWALGKLLNIQKKPKAVKESVPFKAVSAAPPIASEAQPSIGFIKPPNSEPDFIREQDDISIISVIAAAVAAYGEAEGKRYKIMSVKRKEKPLRSAWGTAGALKNTEPF